MVTVTLRAHTYGVEIVKHFVDSDQFIVELIVGSGIWEEGVTIGDKKVKDLYHLCRDSNEATFL